MRRLSILFLTTSIFISSLSLSAHAEWHCQRAPLGSQAQTVITKTITPGSEVLEGCPTTLAIPDRQTNFKNVFHLSAIHKEAGVACQYDLFPRVSPFGTPQENEPVFCSKP